MIDFETVIGHNKKLNPLFKLCKIMADGWERKVADTATIITLLLFVAFVIVCVVCVVPNLYYIERNTADIEDNTANLNTGSQLGSALANTLPQLLTVADGDIKALHDDMIVLHDLLCAAAALLQKIEANTAPPTLFPSPSPHATPFPRSSSPHATPFP